MINNRERVNRGNKNKVATTLDGLENIIYSYKLGNMGKAKGRKKECG